MFRFRLSRPVPPQPATRIAALTLAAPVAALLVAVPVHASGDAPSLLDVGGRRMYVACDVTAAGQPPVATVVLEPALGVAGLSSDALVPLAGALAGRAAGSGDGRASVRVCRSDRAGLGQSDGAPAPRTYRPLVEDLRAALRAAGAPPPYVLVGLATGGVLAQLYGGWYPDEVAGLVLVNTPVWGQTDFIAQILPQPEREAFRKGQLGGVLGAADEGVDVALSDVEYRALRPPRRVPPLPVAIVSPTPGWGWPEDWSPEAVIDASNFWSELQGELIYLWPGAIQVTAHHSGHDIARDEPEAIVAALDAVLAALAPAGA